MSEEQNVIQDLLAMWKEDAKFDQTDPGTELSKIGTLHAKYLFFLSTNRQSVLKLKKQFTKFKRIKWEYYTGKLDEKRLKKFGWEPFPYILKSDVGLYLDADTELQTMQKQLEVYEEIVDVCLHILKELNARTWQAKEIITWLRYTSGE